MAAAVFVDTNILVYARDADETAKQSRAVEWLDRLWREQLGRTSAQVLNEYYYTVTRKLKPGLPPLDAWDDVQALMTWDPQPTDVRLMRRARDIEQRYRLSWWDSLVVGAAVLQDCAVLLSEDLQTGSVYGGVTVCNPFTTGVADIRATYRNAAAIVPQHRSRGRPRRASLA
jgi:predicted nucleic acid-binding protein